MHDHDTALNTKIAKLIIFKSANYWLTTSEDNKYLKHSLLATVITSQMPRAFQELF